MVTDPNQPAGAPIPPSTGPDQALPPDPGPAAALPPGPGPAPAPGASVPAPAAVPAPGAGAGPAASPAAAAPAHAAPGDTGDPVGRYYELITLICAEVLDAYADEGRSLDLRQVAASLQEGARPMPASLTALLALYQRRAESQVSGGESGIPDLPERPARQRLRRWAALYERLLASQPATIPPAELAEVEREYQFLRAWEIGMVRKVTTYLVALVLLLSGAWLGVALTYTPFLNPALPYLTAAYWGAVGASCSGLWTLLRRSAARTLSADDQSELYLKPLTGAFLAVVVALVFRTGGGGTQQPLTSIWTLSAMAGLFERPVFHKLYSMIDTLFGMSGTGEPGGGTAEAPRPPAQPPRTP